MLKHSLKLSDSDNQIGLLVVNYAFPPHPGVGGRRWVKFCKYLSQDNRFNLFVLGAKNSSLGNSNWSKDLKDIKNLKYFTFETNFPKCLLSYPATFLDKVKYRFFSFYVKCFSPGDPYDRSCLDNKVLCDSVEDILKSYKIDIIIISLGPNHAGYFISKLKSSYPSVTFVLDFRDPWVDFNQENFYYKRSILERETRLEKETIKNVDYILTISDYYTNLLKFKYEFKKSKIFTITNGFESCHKGINTSNNNLDTQQLIFSFVGSLHVGVSHVFYPFIETLVELKTHFPELYSRIRINFYGDIGNHYLDFVKRKRVDNFYYFGYVDEDKAKEVIKNSHMCMVFLMKNYEFSMSTKFFEYINLNKKVLVISESGSLPDIITKTNAGLWLSPSNMLDNLLKILDKLINENYLSCSSTFPKEDYDIRNISVKLKNLLVNLINEK